MEAFDYIRKNYLSLCDELREIAEKAGTAAPKLVCVTKSGSDEELVALVRAGATDIGENRPTELKRRGELLSELGLFPALHEIGTLQRNKVKLIAKTVDTVHSLDSIRLAEVLDRHAAAAGRTVPVLIEINSAREAQKSGVMPEEAEELAAALSEYKNLSLRGLMTMGPVVESQEQLRPYFKETKKLFDKLTPYYENGCVPILSMGMSDSYRVAIEEGSTLVRVGRRLFIK